MTWAEFLIRSYAYRRKEKKDLMKLREAAWITYIAPHQDPKKMHRNINSFWPLDGNKSKVTESMIHRIKQAKEQYYKELKEKNG